MRFQCDRAPHRQLGCARRDRRVGPEYGCAIDPSNHQVLPSLSHTAARQGSKSPTVDDTKGLGPPPHPTRIAAYSRIASSALTSREQAVGLMA